MFDIFLLELNKLENVWREEVRDVANTALESCPLKQSPTIDKLKRLVAALGNYERELQCRPWKTYDEKISNSSLDDIYGLMHSYQPKLNNSELDAHFWVKTKIVKMLEAIAEDKAKCECQICKPLPLLLVDEEIDELL